jgi:hypothetical protein
LGADPDSDRSGLALSWIFIRICKRAMEIKAFARASATDGAVIETANHRKRPGRSATMRVAAGPRANRSVRISRAVPAWEKQNCRQTQGHHCGDARAPCSGRKIAGVQGEPRQGAGPERGGSWLIRLVCQRKSGGGGSNIG